MITLLIMLVPMAFLVSFGIYLSNHNVQIQQAGGKAELAQKVEEPLTWAAKQLIKEYNSLPVEHQQFGDIERIVRALDIKYKNLGNEVFASRSLWDNYMEHLNYNWMNSATEGNKEKEEARRAYHSIWSEIYQVQIALDRRKEALKKKAHDDKVAEYASDLADAEELTRRLRQEREIISEVTKDLTGTG